MRLRDTENFGVVLVGAAGMLFFLGLYMYARGGWFLIASGLVFWAVLPILVYGMYRWWKEEEPFKRRRR